MTPGPTEAPAPVEQPPWAMATTGVPDQDRSHNDRTPDRRASDRRGILVAAMTAGVVMLFLGWAIGRTGGDESSVSPDSDPVDSEAVPTTSIAPAVSTLPTVSPDDLPSTTRPPRTTTTTVAPVWTVESIEVDERAADLGLRIVGLDHSGTLHDIDGDRGEHAAIQTDVRLVDNGAVLYAGDDWAMVAGSDVTRGSLYRGRAAATTVAFGPYWNTRQQPGTDRFWTIGDNYNYPEPQQAIEVTVDGEPTGKTMSVDPRYWIAGSDPAGGLVVMNAPGGSYQVAPEGSRRISTGAVLALNGGTVLANECGDTLESCALVVIDRASGDSRPVVSLEDGESPWQFDMAGSGFMFQSELPSISPDGRWAPVMRTADNNQSVGLLDLTTGAFVPLPGYPESGLLWVDVEHVAYLQSGAVKVFDLGSLEEFQPFDSYGLAMFAVRLAGGPPVSG